MGQKLFSQDPIKEDLPLAKRAAPSSFEEVLGQEHLWSKSSALYKLVLKDKIHSILFWGPPGTGKTSLASIIAKSLDRPFAFLSAVRHGVKDIRQCIQDSRDSTAGGGKASILFMDEIHRLNKAQQDVLLPAVEEGWIKLIGATTENPSFEVNSALLSRSSTFKFRTLPEEAVVKILQQALQKIYPERAKDYESTEVLQAIASSCNGDARQALHLLEATVHITEPEKSVTLETLQQLKQEFVSSYDKNADQHYDIISAFIKSIRASKADAAVYYLARMLAGGEDPMFIARRLVIAASEDVGLADSSSLVLANAALQSIQQIGMPEARILLSHVTVHLAKAPKSNHSYKMINTAEKLVESYGDLEIPMHLRNAPTSFMKKMGYGKNYKYAHDDPEGASQQHYLPKELLTKLKQHQPIPKAPR